MLRQPTTAFALALASLLLAPVLGACTPVPSKSEASGEASEQAKPEATCANVRGVASAESSDPAVLDQVERDCVEALTALQNRYETFSTCLSVAGDRAAIVECEKSLDKPRSLLASVGPQAQVEALCDHVLQMLTKQLSEAGSNMAPDEIAQLRTQCIQDAGAQLELKGAEAFGKEAECILRAQTIDALQACGV